MATAMAMDTTTNSPKMISSQATATAIMDSTVTQATGHKTTSNQHHHTTTQTISTYLHRPIHLNHNLNDPTTHTSHHLKIKIAQMAMETAISTHKAAIDTRARANIQLNLNYNHNNNNVNQVLNTVDKKRTNQDNNTKYDDANYSFRLRSTILPFSNFVTIN